MRPSAGRMRPNTSASGILSTKRSRPVSTSMLTSMLVPKPKKALQSPGVQRAGLGCSATAAAMFVPSPDASKLLAASKAEAIGARRVPDPKTAPASGFCSGFLGGAPRRLLSNSPTWPFPDHKTALRRSRYLPAQRLEGMSGGRDPTEDAALRLDHGQSDLVKVRKIRAAAVAQDHTAKAAIVRLAHRGIDTHLGGDTTHQQVFDAAVAQHELQFGLIEGALTRLVDHGLSAHGIEWGNDVMTWFSAHENASHGTRRPDPQFGLPALQLDGRRVGKVGTVAFSRVAHQQAGGASGVEHGSAGFDRGRQACHVVAEGFAETPGFEEVALHIDDDECGPLEVEHQGGGFGFNRHERHDLGPAERCAAWPRRRGEQDRGQIAARAAGSK